MIGSFSTGTAAAKNFGIALSLFLTGVVANLPAQNWDINLLKDINLHRDKGLDPSFRFLSNSVTPLSIAIPVAAVVEAAVRKDSTTRSKAWLLCGSMIRSAVLSTALKYAVHRERPFIKYPFIEKETYGGSYSFPSGHTSAAFALATSVSIAFPRWYIIAPSYLWASLVGYSRMDLGVHYPSDVIAGALIGAGSAYVSFKVNHWIVKGRKYRHY